MDLVTLILLTTVSSRMPTGTPFVARDAQSGKNYTGRIVSIHAARHWNLKRWRDWDGTLRLELDHTDVAQIPVKGFTIDSEGTIKSPTSKVRSVVHLGEAVVAAKVADDATDLIIAAHGGAINHWRSKVVAAMVGLSVYFCRKGQDAKLPAGTAVQVKFH